MEIFGKKIDGLLIIIGILVLASVSWWFVSSTSSMMMKGQKNISTQLKAVDDYKYEKYKNQNYAHGENIKNLINDLRYDDGKIKVNIDGDEYGWVDNKTYKGLDIEANDINRASYIAPDKKYSAQLIKNNNGVVTEIFFSKNTHGKWRIDKFTSLIYDLRISEIRLSDANYFALYHQGDMIGNIAGINSYIRTSSLVFEEMDNLRVKIFSDSAGFNIIKELKIVGNIVDGKGTGLLSE